jgi:hypothetical protein
MRAWARMGSELMNSIVQRQRPHANYRPFDSQRQQLRQRPSCNRFSTCPGPTSMLHETHRGWPRSRCPHTPQSLAADVGAGNRGGDTRAGFTASPPVTRARPHAGISPPTIGFLHGSHGTGPEGSPDGCSNCERGSPSRRQPARDGEPPAVRGYRSPRRRTPPA